ncbi:conjugal transfer nickase/helicase domain-containing protein [Legionella spiritensis]|uniref:Putative helicase/relaxase n=1 Tax=Legionella spiritensis TaxID=452 RepID=A0A0W0ZAY6_LEGSP|nr:TraI domain-containing protein [Legionella spiritensis]KTD66325.1 putative helicase/relaxase [Legionella spiritensis]SNV48647.1 putative helicase/relaxase [Legionella spiritensis]
MFHRYGKKGKSSQAKPLKELTRIVATELLLDDEKRRVLLQRIEDACSLETTRYDSLCRVLVHNLVNHCQSLPETSNSYYSQPGGLLDHALNRTEAALSLFRRFLIREDSKDELSEEQKLWQYALFSAALLQGIGKLYMDLRVDIFDNSGLFLKQWNPLLESLVAVGSHYKYEFQKEGDIEFRRRLNLMLARWLMPSAGFAWIASNPQVLTVWLALLNEDPYAAGTLGAILIRADAIAIQRYFNQLLARNYGARTGRYSRVSTFAGGTPESLSDLEQITGMEFIQWLTKALEGGRLMINKAPLFMVPGGLLMSPDVFKLFVREHPEFKNWQAIQNGFLSLGMHKVGPDGNAISRFEQSSNQQMHSGIVFADYAVALPDEVGLHQMNTGKSSKISATEFIYQAKFNQHFTGQTSQMAAQSMQYLNASGQWQQTAPAAAAALRPGSGALHGV